jgi:hypothetical protein
MPEETEMGRTEELAVSFAKEWAQLPAPHLRVALKAWENERKRQHDLALVRERNRNRLDLLGMVTGFVVSLASIGGATVFGFRGDYWMAAIMLGPSLFAVTKLFVLRKSEKGETRQVGAALQMVAQSGTPPQQA